MVTLLQITVDHSAQDKLHFLAHTCLPQNCIFRNKNHQNPEQSRVFRNTPANVSPHIWNNSCYQILWENHRAILQCAPPLPNQHRCEHCLLVKLDCLPVWSFHNSTANFKVHASVTFLVYGDERPLLMVCFLKCLEKSPFYWRWFCRCEINRPSHVFPHTQNLFTNGTLVLKIYLACSFMDVKFSLGNFGELLLLCIFCVCVEHSQELICIFLFFTHAHRIQKWLP